MSTYAFDVQENIHGLLDFTEVPLVEKLLSTRELRRLKRISQLGLAKEVYPTAEHSRFVHSLGAAHVALRFALHLKEECRRTNLPDALHLNDEAVADFTLAALCHDLGHGPFSHAWEQGVVGKDFNKAEWCRKLGLDPNEKQIRRIRKWHELVGQGLLASEESTIRQTLGAECAERVRGLLAGNYRLPYLHHLLSSDLDVDRCDFIYRDSQQSGVSYGQYDLDWLVASMTFGQTKDEKWVVGFKRAKAKRAIEQLIIARTALYEKVYYHKTVKSAEIMMGLVFTRLKHCVAKHGSLPPCAQGILFEPVTKVAQGEPLSVPELLRLDEHVVDVLFQLLAHESIRSYDPILQDLADRLVNRKLFKEVKIPQEEDAPARLANLFERVETWAQEKLGPLNPREAVLYYCREYYEKKEPLSGEHKDEVYLINPDSSAVEASKDHELAALQLRSGTTRRLYIVDALRDEARKILDKKPALTSPTSTIPNEQSLVRLPDAMSSESSNRVERRARER